MNEFEHIRKELRDLIKYIPIERVRYTTDFSDEILSTEWKEAELENDDLKNYKAKAEYYVRQHQDNAAIAKLKGNIPLTAEDVKELEKFFGVRLAQKRTMKPNMAQSLWENSCGKSLVLIWLRRKLHFRNIWMVLTSTADRFTLLTRLSSTSYIMA